MGMYSNDDWMTRHNRNAAAYAEAMKKQEAAKEHDRAAAERYLLAANNRPANHRSAEVLSAPLGGFKGSTKKDLDLGGLRMLKNAVTGQRSGDWEEQAKTDVLAGITRPALIPATASVNAKEAVTWGILNAGLAKMQGKSWSEAMSEGVDGMVAGATMSIMPGSNLKGVTKVVADAGKFGALDTAGSLVKGESIGDALKDGAAGATAALAFGAVGEVYSKLPDPVKTFVRRVALGGAMGATMRGDESKKPMPTGSFEHLAEWLGTNQDKGFDDYLGTISDQDAAAYSASFKDRKFELPEGVDFFSEEAMARYTLHNALMNRANVRQAAKAGAPKRKNISQMAKFLATDDVPETIFGIPVITREDQYTDADLQFFKEHPEAGGYYDMGEGTPEDGSPEGAPVQKDDPIPVMDRQLQHDVIKWADEQLKDPMKFSKAGTLDRTEFTPKFAAGTMKCNGFVAQAFNRLDGYHTAYPVDMKTGGMHQAAQWVDAGNKKWQKPIPKGWIEVPMGQQQAGDIIAAVSSTRKPGQSGHIGIVGADRKSSYNARVNEGLQLTEFPFKPTKMKDGSTVEWKNVRIFRYIQPSSKKKGAR